LISCLLCAKITDKHHHAGLKEFVKVIWFFS
jgi:hypothetical protein